jgi:peptide-methionine (R)-S-oxide reductase
MEGESAVSGELKILLLASTEKRHRREVQPHIFGGRKGILTIGLGLLVIAAAGALAFAVVASMNPSVDRAKPAMSQPTHETKHADDPQTRDYRSKLTEEQYYVTREKGTERPYSGKYWDHKETGTYACVCCRAPLFESKYKIDAGTGWPSFDRPIDDRSIKTSIDQSLLETRTEVMCRKCNAHLGHVYDNGPTATRLRYSINSAALDFQKGDAEGGATGH